MIQRLALIAALISIPFSARSYELNPSRTASWVSEATHESLTLASLACARAKANSGQKVDDWNCLPEFMNFAADMDTRWSGAVAGNADPKDPQQVELQELIVGVRWPDDPLGRLAPNLPVSAGLHFKLCENWLKDGYAECGNRFCQSHFGHMQMLHAMKPSLPWCSRQGTPSTSATCAMKDYSVGKSIEAWVRWLAPIGAGVTKSSDRVFTQESFSNVLFDKTNCSKTYPEDMLVPSLFFVNCRNTQVYKPWTWGKCPISPPDDPERLTSALKRKAAGAILHVIQDSFARGHTFRPAVTGKDACAARISCTPIAAFNDYAQQSSKKHGKADAPPLWDASCFADARNVDDPITAGAKVIRMLEGGDPNGAADRVWEYLSKRVFVEATASKEATDAATKCFAR